MALPPVTNISSAQNQVFRDLLDCEHAKGIKKHDLFIVSGERAVRDIVRAHASLTRDLIVCEGRHSPTDPLVVAVLKSVGARKLSVISLAQPLFEQLDWFGTRRPLVALTTPDLGEAVNSNAEPEGLEILCALGDPANVGALLRSAAAFGASRVILLKESATPFHPKAIRAASAATLATPLVRGPSIREITSPVIALDMEGESLTGFEWPRSSRLLIGEEGQGVPELPRMKSISIPMRPSVESLNAPIAASIALFSYRSRFPL